MFRTFFRSSDKAFHILTDLLTYDFANHFSKDHASLYETIFELIYVFFVAKRFIQN